MIVSAFSDSERKDKIAEFYDTTYPCSFMRGILTEAEERDKEVEITFTARQEYKPAKEFDKGINSRNIGINSFYSEEFIKANEKPIYSEEMAEAIDEQYEKLEQFYGEDL